MAFLILAFTIKEKTKPSDQNKTENFKSFRITDTAEITLNKNSEIAKFLNERIKLINTLNANSNNNPDRTIKEVNEGTKRDSSTPNPLIVIDGKEVGKKSTTDLNQLISPEKIESINVLKGAPAIAKYGEKGKDGAIEIISKQGANVDNLMEKVARQNLFEVPPLVIIDGKESDRLKELSPDEIASMSVLKGPSATEKYGEKGKGGVIEIITKPSKSGSTNKETIKEIRVEGVKIRPAESKSETKKNNQIEIKEVTLGKPDLNEVVVTGYGKKDEDANKIFEKMEKEPEFPGGREAWRKYLEKNLDASTPTKLGAPSGTYTVTVQFIVDMQGNISNIKPLTKHGYGMEEELIRLIKTVPKWIPGVQNGRTVNAYKKQDVTFLISVE